MSYLNEQVWLNQVENAAIRAGLDIIVNRFARINMGGVYAPEVLYFNIAHKFPKRLFDQDIFERTLNLRNRLQATTTAIRAHFRMDLIDFSLAAFALRIAKAPRPDLPPNLARKLETYRKRRKRAIQKRLGDEDYRALEGRWTGFMQFVRYSVLPMRGPRKAPVARGHHKDQFIKLKTLAVSVIEERCTEPLLDEEIDRTVRRFKNDARRGRKGMKLRELLAQPERTKQMLFEIFRKRLTLHLKSEFQSLAERSSARAKKFDSALVIEDEAGNEIPAKSAAPTLTAITPEKVVRCLENFFVEEIHRDDWAAVKDQVEFLSSRYSLPPKHIRASSFEGLMKQWEPPINAGDIFEDINQAALWLISCLSFIDTSPLDINLLVNRGYVAALNR